MKHVLLKIPFIIVSTEYYGRMEMFGHCKIKSDHENPHRLIKELFVAVLLYFSQKQLQRKMKSRLVIIECAG